MFSRRSPRSVFTFALASLCAAVFASQGCSCEDVLGKLTSSVAVEPASLDFGSVPIGITKELDLTIRNTGSFLLDVNGLSADSPFAAPVLTSTIVRPNGSVTISIAYAPSTLGPHGGTLTLATSDEETPTVVIPLSGIGIAPAVSVEPREIDFGQILWTAMSAPAARSIVVSNPGTAPFSVVDIALVKDGGGMFAFDPMRAIAPYAPGSSASLSVSYTPEARGAVTGSLRIRTTADTAPEILVPLRAEAVGPQIEICANAEGATETCTGSGARPKLELTSERSGTARGNLRVLNVGDRDLAISSMLVTGQAAEFSFAPSPGSTNVSIAPGSSSSWSVVYTPADYTFDVVIVSFSSNSGTRSIESLRVEGRVPHADLEVTPRSLTFHLSGAAQRSITPVRLWNCGLSPLIFGSITVRHVFGPAPSVTVERPPLNGAEIPPQDCSTSPAEATSFDVVFQATTNGTYEEEVDVPSNDPNDPVITIHIAATKD